MKAYLTICCLAVALSASAQILVGPTDAAAGLLVVAPGQIVTLQVVGLKLVLNPSAPVVTDLSITFQQSPPGAIGTLSAPILNIQQGQACISSSVADCLITFITVQVPNGLLLVPPGWQGAPIQTLLTITENGVASKPFPVGVVANNIHVLSSCNNQFGSCVTHADGTFVSVDSPATAGETVVVYAVGLGSTNPPVATGAFTPTTGLTVTASPVAVQLDFTPNAMPLQESGYSSSRGYFPDGYAQFSGLTPGMVGLYQVNVTLPSKFPAIPACGAGADYDVTTNLMISIFTVPGSSDGAPICVVPTQ